MRGKLGDGLDEARVHVRRHEGKMVKEDSPSPENSKHAFGAESSESRSLNGRTGERHGSPPRRWKPNASLCAVFGLLP